MKTTLLIILVAIVIFTGGWISNQSVTLDYQNTVTITDTTSTEIVPAATGRTAVITYICVSSDTAGKVTLASTGEELPVYRFGADSTGSIATSDGVSCYGASGVNITATFSEASHNSTVYVRYRYQ